MYKRQDLDIGVNSKILKFADDTKLFRPVLNHSDGMSYNRIWSLFAAGLPVGTWNSMS